APAQGASEARVSPRREADPTAARALTATPAPARATRRIPCQLHAGSQPSLRTAIGTTVGGEDSWPTYDATFSTASRRSSSESMLYLSNTDSLRWPLIAMATFRSTPALRRFRTPVR